MAFWQPAASIVTTAPSRTRRSSRRGMAVISLLLAALLGQDQLPQAGQAGAVQQQQGRLHGRLRLQPVHQAQVGVPRGGGVAQGQPQPEPGLVVVREGGHRGHAVGAPGQGHQQRGQEHG